jgi:hypothetical protein
MKPKILKPTDLEIGMKVTVVRKAKSRADDRSYMGDVLLIEAVQLPYIVCSVENRIDRKYRPILHTKENFFMELSEEFIAAAMVQVEIQKAEIEAMRAKMLAPAPSTEEWPELIGAEDKPAG